MGDGPDSPELDKSTTREGVIFEDPPLKWMDLLPGRLGKFQRKLMG